MAAIVELLGRLKEKKWFLWALAGAMWVLFSGPLGNTAEDLKVAIFTGVLGSAFLSEVIVSHKKKRKVQDTPRSKVASAPQGLVEIQGFAWPRNTSVKNSQNQEAVYLSILLQEEQTQGSGKNRRKVWVTIKEDAHADLFYLIDPTGLVIIDPVGVDLNLQAQRIKYWRKLSTAEKEHLVATYFHEPISGFPPSNFLWGIFSKKFRIVESEILAGSPLYANGDFRTHQGQTEKVKVPGLTSFTKKTMNLEARSFKNLKPLLDKNGDGKVSETEARTGLIAAAALSRLTAKGTTEKEIDFEVFGQMEKTEEHPLIVADTHEEHLVERLGKHRWKKIIAGSILMTVCIGSSFGMINFKTPSRSYASKSSSRPKSGLKRYLKEKQRKELGVGEEATPAENPVKVATSLPDLQALHFDCVGGKLESCKKLLTAELRPTLAGENVKFYEYTACKGGLPEYCRGPAQQKSQ